MRGSAWGGETSYILHTGDFNCKHEGFGNKTRDSGGILLKKITEDMNLSLTNENTPTHTNDTTNHQDILDLMFISPPIIPHFRDFWVGEDLGYDHNTIIGVFSRMLYDNAGWKDINQTITNSITNHTLDMHTSTI